MPRGGNGYAPTRRFRQRIAEAAGVAQRGGSFPRLAARLNALFEDYPNPATGKPWTNEEAAAAITAAGTPLSAPYLSQLRTGARQNPSARHMFALARLFGVPTDYFIDDEM